MFEKVGGGAARMLQRTRPRLLWTCKRDVQSIFLGAQTVWKERPWIRNVEREGGKNGAWNRWREDGSWHVMVLNNVPT